MKNLYSPINQYKLGANRPFETKAFNQTVESLSSVVVDIIGRFNDVLIPLINSLPNGDRKITSDNRTDTIDPIENGFDGSQLYLDCTSTSEEEGGEYFNNTNTRPYTIKEYIQITKDTLNSSLSQLNSQISKFDPSSGLSSDIKARIGLRIFDPTTVSANSSLDGKTIINNSNLDQLSADIFNLAGAVGSDTSYTFTGNGKQTIVPSIVDRLGSLETYILAPVLQSNVSSSAGNADLSIDLSQIRNTIQLVSGAVAWTSLPTTSFGAATSLQKHISYTGTGTPGTHNPHGLSISDLDNWMDAIPRKRVYNGAPHEEVDGVVTTFTLALPCDIETDLIAISDSTSGWVANTIYYITLPFVPSYGPGCFFSDTGVFTTEITGSLPAYPGQYVVGYKDAVLPAGLLEGQIAYMSNFTGADAGSFAYYTKLIPLEAFEYSLTVFFNGLKQRIFVDFTEDTLAGYILSVTFPTAPVLDTEIDLEFDLSTDNYSIYY